MLIQGHPGFCALLRAKLTLCCLFVAIALASPSTGKAQAIWDGGGTSNAWSDPANWGATVPTSGGTLALQFGGTLQLASNNDFASFTASSLTFNAGAGAFTLSGNAITLAGNLTNNSSNLQSISLGLTLASDSSFNTGTTGLSVGGSIAGNFALTKAGAGVLTLNGANSFSGLTTIATGSLVVGNNLALGSTAQGTSVANGAFLQLSSGIVVTNESLTINGSGDSSNTGALRAGAGDATWAGSILLGSGQGSATVTGGARLGTTGTGNLLISGNISDGGNNFDLVIRSATGVTGKVILSATGNAYHDTYVVVGTAQLGTVNTIPTANVLTLGNSSNQGTATLEMDGFDQQLGTLNSAGGATTMAMKVNNGNASAVTLTVGAGTFGGSLSGNLALTKTTTGSLTLSDAGNNQTNSYSGLTSITAGSLIITKASALGASTSGTVVSSGAALVLGAGVTMGAESLSLAGTGLSTAGALRAQSGTSSWAGLITLSAAAEIQVDATAALTLDVASGSAITGTNANLTLDVAGTLTIADPIATGSGTLIKNGSGTATFSGTSANSFTGSTSLTAGTLILAKSNGINAIGSSTISIGDGSGGLDVLRLGNSNQIPDAAVLTFSGSGITAGVLQLNGSNETVGGVASSSGAGIIENEGGTASTLTITNTSPTIQSFTGIIRDGDGTGTDGSLKLAKSGTGTLVLSGSNSFTGTMTINGGSVQVLNASALGSGDGTMITGSIVASGAKLEINAGLTITNEAVTINGTGGDNNGALRGVGGGVSRWNGPIILGSGTGTGGTRVGTIGVNSSLDIAGQITDNSGGFDLAIRTDGSAGGKVVMSGAGNSYKDTYLVVGTLQLDGGDDRLPTTGQLTIGNTSSVGFAAVDLNGRNQKIAGLTSLMGAGPMTRTISNTSLSSSVLTIQNTTAFSYGGDISGDISLVKLGAGTQTLSGINSYGGRTSIQAGTLSLSGTASIGSSSWIDIGSGATLNANALTGGGLTYQPSTGSHPISGTGSIVGNLTVSGTGLITPGTSSDLLNALTAGDGYGTIAISGGLTFSPSSPSTLMQLGIFSNTLADKITVGGALTLNGQTQLRVSFDPRYQQAWGDAWELLDWASALTLNGFDVNSANNLDLPVLDNGWNWQISNFSGSGSLVATIVPEPTRCCLIALGSLGAILRRRRR